MVTQGKNEQSVGTQVRLINGECLVLGVRPGLVAESGLTRCDFLMRIPKGGVKEFFKEENRIMYKSLSFSRHPAS